MQKHPTENPFRAILLPFLALALCALLWPATLSFDLGDWPSPHQFPNNAPTANLCGAVGAWFAYYIRYWLGAGVYPLLIFVTVASLARVAGREVRHRWERGVGLLLVVACTSAIGHLLVKPTAGVLPVGHGGILGYALGGYLQASLDQLGTVIVIGACLFVGLAFATEGWVLRLPAISRGLWRQLAAIGERIRYFISRSTLRPQIATEGITTAESAALLATGSNRGLANPEAADSEDEDEEEEEDECYEEDDDEDEEYEDEEEDEATASESITAASRPEPPPPPIVNFPRADPEPSGEPYPRQIENWRLPSLDLLEEPSYGFGAEQEQVVRKQAQVLEQTLRDFRIDARVVEIDTGPVITMFELRLGAGIKVSQISTLSNDIARALKAHGIRVVAPISGKNTVGIEVPNVTKEKVRLSELIISSGKKASQMQLPLFLGKDAGGAALTLDLTRMPHLLIAGTTGSGKSVCLNSIILSLLMTTRPDRVKLILIDPKMVELNQFKDVPHLMCPIVHDMSRAEKILEWAVTKMDERYSMLSEARVKNIQGYNNLSETELFKRLGVESDEERARIATHLPYVVIVIDELADLMMTSAKEVEHHLSRLAQKSRAVGIHIIVATQRPEAKVVTGLIKSNLPSRICFRVASRMDSRIVLDQNGGEVLLGQGDMLLMPPGEHKLIRAQGTFLEDSEVHAVLDDLAKRAKPEFHPELIRLKTEDSQVGGLRDPMFDEAVKIVLQSRRGSASLLQRRLTIGYSRASRLIEQMADGGIVGEYKGSQAREVLISQEQWNALQANIQADHEAGYEADRDEEGPEGSVSPNTRQTAGAGKEKPGASLFGPRNWE